MISDPTLLPPIQHLYSMHFVSLSFLIFLRISCSQKFSWQSFPLGHEFCEDGDYVLVTFISLVAIKVFGTSPRSIIICWVSAWFRYWRLCGTKRCMSCAFPSSARMAFWFFQGFLGPGNRYLKIVRLYFQARWNSDFLCVKVGFSDDHKVVELRNKRRRIPVTFT